MAIVYFCKITYFVNGLTDGAIIFKNDSGLSTTPLLSVSAKVTMIFLLSIYPSNPLNSATISHLISVVND